MFSKIFPIVLTFAATTAVTHAAIFEFDVSGRATTGLSGPNEVGNNTSPATGTELSPGISYDDSTQQLSLHIGWGSHPSAGNGTDLTGDFLAAYIIGPSNPDGTGTGSPLYDLTAEKTDLSSGGRSGLIDVTLQLIDSPRGSTWTIHDQELQIKDGDWYLNIASSAINSGEIRGTIAPVPEPSHYASAIGLSLLGFAAYRRHKVATCK